MKHIFKRYSTKQLSWIFLLIGIGFIFGFVIGYLKGASDMSGLILHLVDRGLDSANVTINFKNIVYDYMIKGGLR